MHGSHLNNLFQKLHRLVFVAHDLDILVSALDGTGNEPLVLAMQQESRVRHVS